MGDSPVSGGLPSLSVGGMSTSHSLVQYLHHLSGQEKQVITVDLDHNYAKPWNKHPDANIRARPAKFLFMKTFPRHFLRKEENETRVDVETVTTDSYDVGVNPFLVEVSNLTPKTPSTPPAFGLLSSHSGVSAHEVPPPNKTNWTGSMHKLWAKSAKILQADRLGRLTCEGRSNEIVIKRTLMEKAANRLRQLFASVANWEPSLLSWLHSTLQEHLQPLFLIGYQEAMQYLRLKIPSLVDKFYTPPKTDGVTLRNKQLHSDPIQSVLNNHRPKRINGSPLFLIVPNGPQIPHHLTSQRMKHWHNLFGSLGKVITVTVIQKTNMRATDCLHEIRLAVKDKIKECKSTFNEGRPLVLVGFGASSLIAAHCALDNAPLVTATVCLGFPLTGVNGFRGDLDDPLLETTVPTLFVIGQNSAMCTLDDMEDFRERITKTETGLVVVGGCNDRLIVCGAKKRTDDITQGMVDRCLADEIYDFVSCVINPNHRDSFDQFQGHPMGLKGAGSGSRSPAGSSGGGSAKKRKKPVKSEAKKESKQAGIVDKSDRLEGKPEKGTPSKRQRGSNSSETKSVSNGSRQQSDVGATISPSSLPQPPAASSSATDTSSTVKGEEISKSAQEKDGEIGAGSAGSSNPPTAPVPGPPVPDHLLDKYSGFSYGLSSVSTLISSGATRTRQIRAPKQLDI